jgi:xanthine dehydrogenase YagT iron-sulfur-binding subunit
LAVTIGAAAGGLVFDARGPTFDFMASGFVLVVVHFFWRPRRGWPAASETYVAAVIDEKLSLLHVIARTQPVSGLGLIKHIQNFGDDMQYPDLDISRREVIAGSAAAAMMAIVPDTEVQAQQVERDVSTMSVAFEVNGKDVHLELDTRTTLLDALREHLHLTGTKKGCDHGQCGACTVLVNSERTNSCLTLAVMHQDDKVTTIEGIGQPENLHPMQAAFVKHDGYQCGYCTPGQICSAIAVIAEIKAGIPSHVSGDITAKPDMSATEMRERMNGNICRCGAYSNIVDAMTDVAGVRT